MKQNKQRSLKNKIPKGKKKSIFSITKQRVLTHRESANCHLWKPNTSAVQMPFHLTDCTFVLVSRPPIWPHWTVWSFWQEHVSISIGKEETFTGDPPWLLMLTQVDDIVLPGVWCNGTQLLSKEKTSSTLKTRHTASVTQTLSSYPHTTLNYC